MRSLRLRNTESIEQFTIPNEIVSRCAEMSAEWRDYIDADSSALLVPLEMLILVRARPEGMAGAVRKMQEAALGLRAKRKAIAVQRCSDGFLVCDGNSTAVVMAAIGIDHIPVVLLDECSG